jgi:hypothetical protein
VQTSFFWLIVVFDVVYFCSKQRPFKQRRSLDVETPPASAPFFFGSFGDGGHPQSFGGGNASGVSSFGAPFQGFGSAPFQGFGEGGGGGPAPGLFGGFGSAFGSGILQPPLGASIVAQAAAPPPPRRSMIDVLMGAQRAAAAAAAAAATLAAEAAVCAAPKAVASWGGVAVGMAPRALSLPQCHVCRCMLGQLAGLAATSAAAAPVAGSGGPVCSCAHCELATCQTCACQCDGCGGHFCLFCAGSSYIGRCVIISPFILDRLFTRCVSTDCSSFEV